MPSWGGQGRIPNYTCKWPLEILWNALKPNIIKIRANYVEDSRSQRPRGLTRRFAVARLLGSWVRISHGGINFCLVSVVCCREQVSASPAGVSVVCYQLGVSASGWSLVHRRPTECGISECDLKALTMRRPWPTRGPCAMGNVAEYESVRLQFYLLGQLPFTPRNSPEHSSRICTVSPISKGSPYRVSPRQLYTAAKKESEVKLKLWTKEWLVNGTEHFQSKYSRNWLLVDSSINP